MPPTHQRGQHANHVQRFQSAADRHVTRDQGAADVESSVDSREDVFSPSWRTLLLAIPKTPDRNDVTADMALVVDQSRFSSGRSRGSFFSRQRTEENLPTSLWTQEWGR
jgi:hypothetical protein